MESLYMESAYSAVGPKLISSPCLFVNDLTVVISFFSTVLEINSSSIQGRPVRHALINITNQDKILIVEKSACTSSQQSYFRNISVKQIFISLPDPTSVLKLALAAGCQLIESDISESGGSFCVFEGPENIQLHVISHLRSQDENVEDLILNSIQIEDETSIPKAPTKSLDNSVKNNKKIPQKNRAPYFPSLDVTALSNNSRTFVPCPPNSREGVPFETELFKGQVLLMVRTKPIDPHFLCVFEGRKRVFEIQVQGQFKRMPTGELFVGTEASNKMDLGLITRAISRGVINFVSSMVGDLHYSFGDSQDKPNYELPHLAAPLFPSLDKIVVTPQGQTPPPMGIPFPEDPEYRKKRFKMRFIEQANIDLNCVYSFSVCTAYWNLVDWTLTGIPMIRPLDLRTFFGDSSIRLVGYEIPRELDNSSPVHHVSRKLNYVFNVNMTSTDTDKPVHFAIDNDESDDGDISDTNDEIVNASSLNPDKINNSSQAVQALMEEKADEDASFNSDVDGDAGDDDETDEGFGYPFEVDEFGVKNAMGKSLIVKKKKNKLLSVADNVSSDVGSWIRRRIDDMKPIADVPESPGDFVMTDFEFEGHGDLRFCPMVIDLIDRRLMREGRRRTFFLLPYCEAELLPSVVVTRQSAPAKSFVPRFRTYSDIVKALAPLQSIPKMHKNKRMCSEERKRRQVVETYKSIIDRAQSKQAPSQSQLFNLLHSPAEVDRNFLNSQSLVRKGQTKGSEERWEGAIAVATSSRHWAEQHVRVSKAELVLSRSHDFKRISLRVVMGSVYSVRPLVKVETPLPAVTGFAFFQIETFARVHYFMVKESQLKEWMAVFSMYLGTAIVQTEGSTVQVPNSLDAIEPYLAKPSATWKLAKRRIFNCRKIIFNTQSIAHLLPTSSPTADASADSSSPGPTACSLVEDMLCAAGALALAEESGTATGAQWLDFSDKISILQVLDCTSAALTEKQRAAFLLNLYHVLVIHASLVLGPPLYWAGWQSFFNTSYILGFDVASIAEIEHNMLRASMSRPSPLLSKISAPHSLFSHIALTQRDFRLNFCINSGSRSLLPSVPIYKAETLDRQLDEVTIQMLSENVHIDIQRRIVMIPRVCSWFSTDFSLRIPQSANAAVPAVSTVSYLDSIRVIAPYMRGENKQALARFLIEGTSPSIRFKTFNFRCRILLVEDIPITPPTEKSSSSPSKNRRKMEHTVSL